jgi:hypothetical protein
MVNKKTDLLFDRVRQYLSQYWEALCFGQPPLFVALRQHDNEDMLLVSIMFTIIYKYSYNLFKIVNIIYYLL